MLSLEELLLGILEDGFEQSEQWLLDLMIHVELVVYWQVVLEYIERVFGLFITLRTFGSFDHDVSYSVSLCRG